MHIYSWSKGAKIHAVKAAGMSEAYLWAQKKGLR